MTWPTHLCLVLVTCLLFRESFSYPYPSQPGLHPMRRHMVPSPRSSQTWVPYPVMLPPFAPKMSIPDYRRGGVTSPFLRPPMPHSSPLLPSSSFMAPTLTSPPRIPIMSPSTEKTPPARSSDRSSSHSPPRSKEHFRQRVPRPPRTKNIPEYMEKDWDDQDEDKWEKRFNRLDVNPNFRMDRRPEHRRRFFDQPKRRRDFEDDSDERMPERVFPEEREDRSRDHRDRPYFRRPRPMMRRRQDFSRPKSFLDSDEIDSKDRYASREYRGEFFNKPKPMSRPDKFDSSERIPAIRSRSDNYDSSERKPKIMSRSDKFDSSERKPKITSRSDKFDSFARKPKMMSHSDKFGSSERKSFPTNRRNGQRHPFVHALSSNDEKTTSPTNFVTRGSKLHREKDSGFNENALYKNDYKDSEEFHDNYKADEDYSKKLISRKPKKLDPVKTISDGDSAELTWSHEETTERKSVNKPYIPKDKNNGFIYRNHTKTEKPNERLKSGSSEEFGKINQKIEKDSFYHPQIYDSSPSTLTPKSGFNSAEETRKDFSYVDKSTKDFVSTAKSKTESSSEGSNTDFNSGEAAKKESWNWSSTEIVVKDDDTTDSHYDNHNYDNVESEDKEDTEIADSGSDLLKISNDSERSTLEKSYVDDSYATGDNSTRSTK